MFAHLRKALQPGGTKSNLHPPNVVHGISFDRIISIELLTYTLQLIVFQIFGIVVVNCIFFPPPVEHINESIFIEAVLKTCLENTL